MQVGLVPLLVLAAPLDVREPRLSWVLESPRRGEGSGPADTADPVGAP
jgi:hypothetical protein